MEKASNIGILIHRIDKKIKANMDISLNRYDLTYSQSQVLLFLRLNEGKLSQKKLQEMLAVQPGSLSEICGKLEEKGMIERSRDEKDRRSVILKITEKGRRMKEGINVRKDNAIFSSLNEQEREQLRNLLNKIESQNYEQESVDYTENCGKEAAG